MNSLGTTSLDALPISPQTQNVDNNIRLETYDKPVSSAPPVYSPLPPQQAMQQQPPQPQQIPVQGQNDPSVKQRQMNQFVTGLQQASAAGLTVLPSRDIPQNQEQLSRDVQMKPNYIPEPQLDYIAYENANHRDMVENQTRLEQHSAHLENVYDDMQMPILVAVLFFLFQLPVVRKMSLKYLPSLFNSEGNPTITGYMFNSALFALTYYVLKRSMKFIDHGL